MRAVDLSSYNLVDGKDGREEEDNVLLALGLSAWVILIWIWVRRVGRAATRLKHIRPAGTEHVASRDTPGWSGGGPAATSGWRVSLVDTDSLVLRRQPSSESQEAERDDGCKTPSSIHRL
jgi:hypothetical protein